MRRTPEEVPGVQLFTAECFRDERGFLVEAWVRSKLRARGIEGEFRQAVQTVSRRGVARGLHFQWAPPVAKLVRCAQGAVLDVIVDVRIGSPTLGDHVAVELSGENHRLLWVPNGFAHGFMALEDQSMMFYQFTAEWSPAGEGAIRWNDEALGVSWPDIPPIVSERDQRAPTLEEWLRDPRSQNFRYGQDESRQART
ncbi:MAG: dTDP-4-dehydrorhamnose 3,5-epimerase [Acidobacteria bacterium]|nr:MAG: dTDP-4-dehydrorhamnose 3,5-epimerase [Acidobacteriota bacterium]